MDKRNEKQYILLSLLLIVISTIMVSKIMPNDTFFTIKMGQDVIDSGISNDDTITYHEDLKFEHYRWAFDVLNAFIYNRFGFNGIYLFVISISAVISILVFNMCLYKKMSLKLSFVISLICVLISSSSFVARAQMISYVCFIIEVWIIDKLINTNKKKYIMYLGIIPIIIVNFHATIFPLYFILFLPFLAEGVLFKIIKKFKNIEKNDDKVEYGNLVFRNINVGYLFASIILGAICGLLSPSFLASYTYMFKCTYAYPTKVIQELQPYSIFSGLLLFVIIGFMIVFLLLKKTKINTACLFLTLGISFMPFIAVRNIIILYILFPICICDILILNPKMNSTLNTFVDEAANNKYSRIMILVFLMALIVISSFYRIHEEYVEKKSYPVEAVEYIVKNIDIENMRIYNNLNYFSYLELNNIKTFIDSRNEAYCEEFNYTKVFEEWDKTRKGLINYNDAFEKYQITHLLIRKDELLYLYLKNDKNYIKLYDDDYFILYKRNVGEVK